MSITKRTHYNPCFWTALWNTDYYQKFKSNNHINDRARIQKLIYLDLHSNKTLGAKAENLHYDKGLGIAKIQPEKALEFCMWNFPDEYESFRKEIEADPSTLILDFENHFSAMEGLPMYSVLMKTIQTCKIESYEDKTWLTLFILNHQLRSHIFINSMTESYKKMGIEKFEFLWQFKWAIANPAFQAKEVNEISRSKWTIYKVSGDIFPLSDNPIIITKCYIFATLSPDMLLIIKKGGNTDKIVYKKNIPLLIYWKYKRLTIINTFRGLIFSDMKILEKWKSSISWRKRISTIS